MSIIAQKRVFFHEVWMKTAGALTPSGFRETQVAYCVCQAAAIGILIKARQASAMATDRSVFSSSSGLFTLF